MGLEPVSWKEWKEQQENERQYLDQWARDRKLKRCKCGTIYSYLPEHEEDPKACPGCRGLA